jgi:hypothetical protein
MDTIRQNYLVVGFATILSAFAAVLPRQLAAFEPWISILALGSIVLVAFRLGRMARVAAVATDTQGPHVLAHMHNQRRILLVFTVVGVLSCFQWLLFYKQLRLLVALNGLLQALNMLMIGLAVAALVVGFIISLPRKPRPVATGATPQPDVASSDPG